MASSFHHGYANIPPAAPYAGYANVPPTAAAPYGFENMAPAAMAPMTAPMAPMAAPVSAGCAPVGPLGGGFAFILVLYILLVIIARPGFI